MIPIYPTCDIHRLFGASHAQAHEVIGQRLSLPRDRVDDTLRVTSERIHRTLKLKC
jgi:hypothetical protein